MDKTSKIKNDALLSAKEAAKQLLYRAALFSFFMNILMLTGPIYMLQIYDRVLSSRSAETLAVITLLTFFLFAAFGALDFARSAILARAGATFENKLQSLTFDASMDAALATGGAIERPLRDLRQVRQFLASPALTAFFDAPMTPFFLLLIFLMHWLLGVIATIGLLILLGLAFINERLSREANQEALTVSQQADTMASATLRNAYSAHSMGMRRGLKARWLQTSASAQNFAIGAGDKISGLTSASKATRLFLQSAILGAGALLAIRQEITPGVMIAASIIAGRALAPIELVTTQWRNCASALLSYQRLTDFLKAAPTTAERTALPKPVGALELKGIYIQPLSALKPLVKNISFQLAPGESLGVIGPTAAGKSTLARAIVGVERVISGEILLDGAKLDQWDPDELGDYIGYMPQDVELFAGTAAQNISRFRNDASSENIIGAGKAAGAHEMILALSNGYETEIGDNGKRLSAGQRQRIGLARALYGDPKLIVLDEPNANLDSEGDAALAHSICALKSRGATTIIVAHRPSGIAYVDKLLLIANGEIKAFGPRDEILNKIAPGLVTSFEEGIKKRQEGGAKGNA